MSSGGPARPAHCPKYQALISWGPPGLIRADVGNRLSLFSVMWKCPHYNLEGRKSTVSKFKLKKVKGLKAVPTVGGGARGSCERPRFNENP